MGVLGGGMEIRDRIRELRRVPAKQLRANPKNWRMHPVGQREAMQGVLTEIGYADALIARECDDGTLMLIDGHLRAETTPDQMVPVLVLDVTESEADKLLLTLDPLAGMAEVDDKLLGKLLAEVETSDRAIQAMFADLRAAIPEPGEWPAIEPNDEHTCMVRYRTEDEDAIKQFIGVCPPNKIGAKILERIKALATAGADLQSGSETNA